MRVLDVLTLNCFCIVYIATTRAEELKGSLAVLEASVIIHLLPLS